MGVVQSIKPTNVERWFGEDEIIVSKTDLRGRITYANDVFLNIAGYREEEVLDQPHNLIRHPDMPRAVFKLLWETVEKGEEIFAYVKNMTVTGDHYWVFAHVTPSFDANGKIVGYHSNRRRPNPAALKRIQPVYDQLLTEEGRHANAKAGMNASYDLLKSILADADMTYEEFVFSLAPAEASVREVAA